MANKDYYTSLGVNKNATEAEIKKAYKKKAMEYHPDKNAGDKKAEAKFKEINEAYQTLGDTAKRKNYDQFGSAEANPFGGMGGNPFGGGQYRSSGQGAGFEDIFSQFGGMGGQQSGGFEFDIGDLFGGGQKRSKRSEPKHEEPKKEIVNLDVTETVEIPFFDFLYDTSISVKTVYNKVLTLKIKAGTKPGTKFKISGKGRSADGKTGDMFVIVDAKMPKLPLDKTVEKMIEAVRYQI
ncbi:DnaJ domain-containing protein [Candidatus Gracilibacteria bacterium]|nr:DnaJ domain-containing protein [Candidatus Gracilibacteria bacterium]